MQNSHHLRPTPPNFRGRLALVLTVGLLSLVPSAGGAIGVRGQDWAQNGAGAESIALPMPSGIATGDLLLAQLTIMTTGVVPTIATPAGWTQVQTATSGAGATQLLQRVYRKRAGTSEPVSYSWTWAGLGARVAAGGIVAYSGVDTSSNPIIASSTATGGCLASPCSLTSAGIATGGVANWIVNLAGIGTNATWTVPSGVPPLTERYSAPSPGGVSSEAADAVAGMDPVGAQTAIASGPGQWASHLLSLKADGTAPTGVTLTNPAANLRSMATLTSTASDAGSGIASVAFQISPTGAGSWTTVATASGGSSPYSVSFDTTSVGDGLYDFRSVATDQGGNSTGSAARTGRRIDNTPPSAALTAPASVWGGTVTLVATAADTGGSGVASVAFQLSPAGAGAWTTVATDTSAPYSKTFNSTGIADGTYDLRAVATDTAGNVTSSASATDILVDNTAPTGTLVDPGTNLRSPVTLMASASDAASGVASVAFQRAPAGGGSWTTIATDTSFPYTVNGAVPDGLYDLRALVTDVAGNQGPSATIASRRIDSTSPTGVTLTTPAASLGGTVTLTSTASDAGSGIASVDFQISPVGAGNWTTVTTAGGPSSPYSAPFDTMTVSDGLYDFRSLARDYAGNIRASGVRSGRRVDNTTPTVTLAPLGLNLTGVTALNGAAADAGGSGIASVAFQYSPAGAGVWTTIATDATAPYGTGLDTTMLSDGLYDIRALATDKAGNQQDSTSRDLRVDNTPPTAPEGFAAVVADDGLTLRWLPGSDTSGRLGHVRLYADGIEIAIFDATQYEVKMGNFDPSDPRVYTMRQSDEAGNTSTPTYGLTAVPKLAGLSLEAARAALEKRGLVPAVTSLKGSDEFRAGLVVGSEPAGMAQLGQPIALFVSSGHGPANAAEKAVTLQVRAARLVRPRGHSGVVALRLAASGATRVRVSLQHSGRARARVWLRDVPAGYSRLRLEAGGLNKEPYRLTVSLAVSGGSDGVERILTVQPSVRRHL